VRGVPPDAEPGALPRPEYDPSSVSLTRREQAKAGELTAAGFLVTASAVKQRRRRYQERGLLGMVDHRVGKHLPPHGRADPAVADAMRQAIAETAEDSTRTAAFVLRRTRQIRKQMPHASETELADAVEDLLTRAGHGPDGPDRLSTRDRRVAARTAAVRSSLADPGPPGMAEDRHEPGDEHGDQAGAGTGIVPMPIFDPFREAQKWW
jgi:hypothetical protein